jgi:DNA (cytosine-5)-methyltransferase 1
LFPSHDRGGGNTEPKILEEDKFTRVVTIEDLNTGKKVIQHYPSKVDVYYLWTLGNWSCDCNRSDVFGYEDDSCSEGRIPVKIMCGDVVILDESEIQGCAIRGRYDRSGKINQQIELNNTEVSNTITTVQKDSMVLENSYRIRKLTPKECFRLMGLNDDQIDKIQSSGISNSQQYKLAGNSIVVQCMRFLKKLEAIDILNEDKPQGQLSFF